MCGRHFVLDLFDIGSRFTESKSLKKWKISENIQFFGPIFYQVQVVIISHKIRILKSKIRHIIINFVQKNEKNVKIVKIIAFSSSVGNQSEGGGSGFCMLIG